MSLSYGYPCRCGANTIYFRFYETILPEEVIKAVYCPQCQSLPTGLIYQYKGFTVEFDNELLKSKRWLLEEIKFLEESYHDDITLGSARLIISLEEAKKLDIPYEPFQDNLVVVDNMTYWRTTCPTFEDYISRCLWTTHTFSNLAKLDDLIVTYNLYNDYGQDRELVAQAANELVDFLTTKIVVPD
ncbi:hypothetical protein MTAT_19520 [Moorella thermoacetica]|uniref:Uncharacterized protein n=1 Tax=Neomoorella thermoacetica TaxID=1525 RepID=A0AAC9HIT4_NEOTH|nr:hypothetical protein [Moorella thermoacetica]AOQ24609.1 hypothetical protein Maut_02179 [Moorella thermoacetica]TYL12710.1 hypothetical protein MTAT_19520 [Moorella thermoacetica]